MLLSRRAEARAIKQGVGQPLAPGLLQARALLEHLRGRSDLHGLLICRHQFPDLERHLRGRGGEFLAVPEGARDLWVITSVRPCEGPPACNVDHRVPGAVAAKEVAEFLRRGPDVGRLIRLSPGWDRLFRRPRV